MKLLPVYKSPNYVENLSYHIPITDTFTKESKLTNNNQIIKLNKMRADFGIDELCYAKHRLLIAADSKKSLAHRCLYANYTKESPQNKVNVSQFFMITCLTVFRIGM